MKKTSFIKIYQDKSELVFDDGDTIIFEEGQPSDAAKHRYAEIKSKFEAGFLTNIIKDALDGFNEEQTNNLNQYQVEMITDLVYGVTSQAGRALVGLSVLQLSIRVISPKQSIRLHKSGGGSHNFSWKEGLSMRSLDNTYITPILRKYGLLHLNADGFMMTRSLAENYPYSAVYKANLRGAKNRWIELVEEIESNNIDPLHGLRLLIALLINRADSFKKLSKKILQKLKRMQGEKKKDLKETFNIIKKHIDTSDYSARLLEIAMHSFMQVFYTEQTLGELDLKRLSQMRSANKKHGNIGDIELVRGGDIVESWDAKYGKTYLRDELEELSEKIDHHTFLSQAGFVTSDVPIKKKELLERQQDIENISGVKIVICDFESWLDIQIKQYGLIENLGNLWLEAYTESLAQERRNIAPIDEPCFEWLKLLDELLG